VIRHIVAFRLSAEDPDQRKVDVAGMRDRLEPLARTVPGVLDLHVHGDLGLVGSHWHAVLVSDHSDNAALEAYQKHPDHVAAAEWVNTVVTDRAVVDFELGHDGR
jgi:stress responsive alpha/beta barrel protein